VQHTPSARRRAAAEADRRVRTMAFRGPALSSTCRTPPRTAPETTWRDWKINRGSSDPNPQAPDAVDPMTRVSGKLKTLKA